MLVYLCRLCVAANKRLFFPFLGGHLPHLFTPKGPVAPSRNIGAKLPQADPPWFVSMPGGNIGVGYAMAVELAASGACTSVSIIA